MTVSTTTAAYPVSDRVGLIDLPDLAELFGAVGLPVITGPDYRTAATAIRGGLGDSGRFPVIVLAAENTWPGFKAWIEKASRETSVILLRHPGASIQPSGVAAEIVLPAPLGQIADVAGLSVPVQYAALWLDAEGRYSQTAPVAPAAPAHVVEVPTLAPVTPITPAFEVPVAPIVEAPVAQVFEAPAAPVAAPVVVAPAPIVAPDPWEAQAAARAQAPIFEAPAAPVAPVVVAPILEVPVAQVYGAPVAAPVVVAPAPIVVPDPWEAQAAPVAPPVVREPIFETPIPEAHAPTFFEAPVAPAPVEVYEAHPILDAPVAPPVAEQPAPVFDAPVAPEPYVPVAPPVVAVVAPEPYIAAVPAVAEQFTPPAPPVAPVEMPAPVAAPVFDAPLAPEPYVPVAPAVTPAVAPVEMPAPVAAPVFDAPLTPEPYVPVDPAVAEQFIVPPVASVEMPAPVAAPVFDAPLAPEPYVPAAPAVAPIPATPLDYGFDPQPAPVPVAPLTPAFTPTFEAPAAPRPAFAPTVPSSSAHALVTPAPRQHGLAEVMIVWSGKGGVGKSTGAASVAQRAAKAGMRVVLVDANFGQGDMRTYLRIGNAGLPSIYQAAISGDLKQALIDPDTLNASRSPKLDPLGFAVVQAPPAHLTDPTIVTPQAYMNTIEQARRISDLVVIDTQIIESVDSSGMVDGLLLPYLRTGAWALGVTDLSSAGISNLLTRMKAFAAAGVPREHLMTLMNRIPRSVEFNQEGIAAAFNEHSAFLGAVYEDNVIPEAMNRGHSVSDVAVIAPLLDKALRNATGREEFSPQVYAAPAPESAGKAARGGLFGRRKGGR